MAFKAEELMTQVKPGRWKARQGRTGSGENLLMCDQDSQNRYCWADSGRPCEDSGGDRCEQDSQRRCREDSHSPCQDHSQGPCEEDTRKTPCDIDTQPCDVRTLRGAGTAGPSGLALLRQQMQDLLASGQSEAGI